MDENPDTSGQIRVLLAEGHTMYREGLAREWMTIEEVALSDPPYA